MLQACICLQAAADQISTHLQASVAGCIQRGRERNSSIVSPFIFGPGIFLATTSVRRVERADEWGSCSTADLSSLSPSLCSGWADFSCLSRSLEKEEGEGGSAGGRQLPLPPTVAPSSTLTHCDFLTNYCDRPTTYTRCRGKNVFLKMLQFLHFCS